VKTMAEVLGAHGQLDTSSDGERWLVSCMGCSWSQEADDPCMEFAAHQADALTAAGFGPVKAAQAGALKAAAEAAEGMHDPVAPDCQEWADWLRARAASIEADQ
jgi:hypothetical protein